VTEIETGAADRYGVTMYEVMADETWSLFWS
jgi:hypothetical protein